MDCAVCSTPLQLMNMINLATTVLKDRSIDLYILDHSPQNRLYFDALQKTELFQRVSFLNTKFMTGGNSALPILRFLKASSYFLRSRLLSDQMREIPHYERFYIPTPDVPTQLLYYACKKVNPRIELRMYEEGTFAYNYFEHEFGVFQKLFLRFLFQTDIMQDHSAAYVYHPQLLNNVRQLPVFRIQPIAKDNRPLVDFFNAIAKYDPLSHVSIAGEVIFFDQPFLFDAINRRQFELYEIIADRIPKDRLNVKLHPRTTSHPYKFVLPFQVSSEIMEMNESFEDKTLVSVFSTACLSPKMLFDEEPKVLLLYKLVDLHLMTNIHPQTFALAELIKQAYRRPERFMIPATMEELMRILGDIRSETSSV
jgi:hypothetical protein